MTMNNIDTVRMAKALLEVSGFVVVLKGDYDKDQNAFIELDDELKRCKKVNGTILTDLSAAQAKIKELEAGMQELVRINTELRNPDAIQRREKRPNGYWEGLYPYQERVRALRLGEMARWETTSEREADLLRDAINDFIAKSKRNGDAELSSRMYRCTLLGNMIGCKRVD